MTTNELMLVLINGGFRLIPRVGGGLDVDGPTTAVTPEVIEELRKHKKVILGRMAAVERLAQQCHRLDALIFIRESTKSTTRFSKAPDEGRGEVPHAILCHAVSVPVKLSRLWSEPPWDDRQSESRP